MPPVVRHAITMRFLFAFFLLFPFASSPGASEPAPILLSAAQEKFGADLAARVSVLEKGSAGAVAGSKGWVFLTAELRFLSVGQFWGSQAAKVSRSSKAEWADPLAAITDFQKQLKAKGVDLLLVPVPPKAAIYPEDIVPDFPAGGGDAAPYLARFYTELESAGVDVLDLTATFKKNRGSERGEVYCRTDSHWSGLGCVLAAQAIAERIKSKLPTGSLGKTFSADWKAAVIKGDLADLLPPGAKKPGEETIAVRVVSEKCSDAALEADAKSPLLLMGDSHTLVFHDFFAQRAGLLDQLAAETGIVPDLIGTRGSGATTVRLTLYRKSLKDPEYLAKKKLIIWCFTAREFTEASQGWQKAPVAK